MAAHVHAARREADELGREAGALLVVHGVAGVGERGGELHVLVVHLGDVLRAQGEHARHEAHEVVHLLDDLRGGSGRVRARVRVRVRSKG